MGVWIWFIVVTIISLGFAAWVLLLPWMLSLWIWRSSRPMWLRLLLVAALVAGTPVAFFPRRR